jgi:hypothetical protein
MEKQSKILKWSLIVGIVVVLNLFFNYALSLIYKNPTFEAFCPSSQINKVIDNQNACLEKGGQWNENVPYTSTVKTESDTQPSGYCNMQFTCQKNYEVAEKLYDRNVFITLVILGAICVALSSFLGDNIVINIALSFGGVLSFVIASMRYWSSADDLIKVIILAIALSLLIWIAIKKFKN